MFTRPTEPSILFTFEDQPVPACPGETVAAALLAAGHMAFRATIVSGSPRGPFCMMGACFDCLVEIDGTPFRQACMVSATAGMRVRRHPAVADLADRAPDDRQP